MNNKNKKYLLQSALILSIVSLFIFFAINAQINMSNRGLQFGFDFLNREASFDIQFTLIEYSRSSTYLRAYFVGLLNTILVAFFGIIFATILGVIVGIARLSKNYLINNLASAYVEFFRNLPLLLQLFFWYYAALRVLPLPQDAGEFFFSSYLTIKALYVPALRWENFYIFLTLLIISIFLIIITKYYSKKIQEKDGTQFPIFLISIAILLILPSLSLIFGFSSFSIEKPELLKLSETTYTFEGGLEIPPEFIALLFALSLYTATFIAECVRAGIQGVGKGQKEAAASIGLTPNQVLKLEIMPQALRIIIPPTTNQYLNLTKNSSLASAIAYPDLALVFAGTALMQTGKAIEIVSMVMFTYLTLSILTSVLMNWYNKKQQITEK